MTAPRWAGHAGHPWIDGLARHDTSLLFFSIASKNVTQQVCADDEHLSVCQSTLPYEPLARTGRALVSGNREDSFPSTAPVLYAHNLKPRTFGIAPSSVGTAQLSRGAQCWRGVSDLPSVCTVV